MNHIGLVALKGQIMRFIVQPILLQEYRRWDIYVENHQGQFILRDCINILTLPLAVWIVNWDLYVAPLLFNRPHYQKLIVRHLSDLLVQNLEQLRSGTFVASLSGHPGHSITRDKAHEKEDLKTPIVRHSTESMNRLSLNLGHMTNLMDNPKETITPTN